ncbi:ZIP metal ion transporter, putative [Talaromyces stipitatus ATCC 10500]|uniref:ZIP metal ion transporter, putative n=1 Tax=Talaromyces stipitatus (strain ATCC 10500 / CBS 375.48 / QM 6759 / NRRL 1006) TaxID=441959 RepID=B8MLJ0_TALSN|nr:ZIP metal ion transporter, putative [Talaromyces stipitatus ATCC 10500]EED15523.1 ZIP metal ion transporter, putative [Talaromyces stipitatus ATCC 10500]
MEGLFTLLVLSIVMAMTSFVVGALPLSFTLSPSQSRFISSLGMGILVGTALVIIIPEGVETLYSSQNYRSQSSLQTGGLDVRWQHKSSPAHILPPRTVPEIDALPGPVIPDGASSFGDAAAVPPKTPTKPGEVHALDIDRDMGAGDSHDHDHDHEDEDRALHAWIGISLVSGFILMYLIDKLPAFASPPKPRRTPYHISLDNLGGSGLRRNSSPTRDGGLLDQDNNNNNNNHAGHNTHSFAMTTGLVIHAAADGIALGASGSNSNLSFIIFLALLVHKAPAAFGLTSVLLKQGLSSRVAGRHLLVFSLAAPVGALLTFIIVHTLGSGFGSDEASNRWRTGVLLLFSAGTFLYVAMHTIQEITPPSTPSHSNGYADSRETPKHKGSIQDVAISVVGMILPLFLQIGHAH